MKAGLRGDRHLPLAELEQRHTVGKLPLEDTRIDARLFAERLAIDPGELLENPAREVGSTLEVVRMDRAQPIVEPQIADRGGEQRRLGDAKLPLPLVELPERALGRILGRPDLTLADAADAQQGDQSRAGSPGNGATSLVSHVVAPEPVPRDRGASGSAAIVAAAPSPAYNREMNSCAHRERPSRARARLLAFALAGLLLPDFAPAAEPSALALEVRSWRQAHEAAILRELAELVAIPNVAADRENIRRNAEHLRELFARRGFASRLLDAGPDISANPAVYAELEVDGAERTVVFYSHYDGQPVDPSLWASDPWQPTLRTGPLGAAGTREVDIPASGRVDPEWRLFARSVSDDKAPIIELLASIDALAALGRAPSISIKVFLDGEEEAGSDNLRAILERHRDLLAADLWLFCDGPVHQSRRQQVVFGVRGVTGADLTVYGPKVALHSGHYGNWAPNPGALLVDLLASMRSPAGDILIDGFAGAVVPMTRADHEAIAAAPPVDDELRRAFGLAVSEADNAPLGERIMQPAINFRGLTMARTGPGATNAIPTEAHATVGFPPGPRRHPRSGP